MDTRTLEQVIMDASRGFYEPRARSHMVTAEAEVIADAVRAWMRERECIMPGSLCKKTQDNARIKELEAEVERMRSGIDEWAEKAAKYDALRERFPFWPGEEFWTFDPDGGKIVKRIAQGITVFGVTDNHANEYRWDECHPTADACKAAIPVEEWRSEMHDRTRRIKAAIRYAKMRDSFRCRVCGRNEHLCGSPAAPRNVLDPTDPAGIITMCAWCDDEFGKIHSIPQRAEWLRFHRLDEFADWMAERDGRCA